MYLISLISQSTDRVSTFSVADELGFIKATFYNAVTTIMRIFNAFRLSHFMDGFYELPLLGAGLTEKDLKAHNIIVFYALGIQK